MERGYTFVLVHGAWHYGDLWAPVAENLRIAGHEVHTPTVAGHAYNAQPRERDVGHADGVASVVEYIRRNGLKNIVLVGHSFGGSIISRVAEEVPELIRRLVYWNAFVLKDGESVADVSPPTYNLMMDAIAEERGDNCVVLPYQVWRDGFIGDADEATAKHTYGLLCPEPYRMLTDKVPLKSFDKLQIPKSYLNAQADVAMPPGEYAWFPRFAERLFPCRVVHMSGSHQVMFSNPAGLAEKIIQAGRD
ncbi:alpha/beta fold hydrolase [Paraburkholderia dipogonis]|uniref:Alpha/beta fold hydrolase n=1 Tax=Paraburkholderia dipogonis TaxID=1211383 RepID=A0A4Y8MS31_9BURK|nr:alpha/beta hydrolase [Paraburkholderia dipogonis]TFE40208.1 alpha/beta fold hydrolase [Paraburkholderia dipogonis]